MQQPDSPRPPLFAGDENFNRHIVEGILRSNPRIDIIRVQDTNLAGANDSAVLAWAAETGRVLLTHDANTDNPATLVNLAYKRMSEGLPMPGVIVLPMTLPLGEGIEWILIAAACSSREEWEYTVTRLR